MTIGHFRHEIIKQLAACSVPKEAIRIIYGQNENTIAVELLALHGKSSRHYTIHYFAYNFSSVMDDMIELARWYHCGTIPVRPHWWWSKPSWNRAIIIYWIGLGIILTLSIAKYFRWYK